MQKLIWTNAKGDSIDFTSGDYGVTEWEGFSNVSLNIQSQKVPFADGSVYLDSLLDDRELSVTLAIQDNNDLQKRYRLRNEIISILNPKLGEGYLIYKNDFVTRRIKAIPQVPIFQTKNSNTPGTPKANLSWIACGSYWEDLEEISTIISNGVTTINNESSIPVDVKFSFFTTCKYVNLINETNANKIMLRGNLEESISIDTNTGNKKIQKQKFEIIESFIKKNLMIFDAIHNVAIAIDYMSVYESSDFKKWNLISTIPFDETGYNIYPRYISYHNGTILLIFEKTLSGQAIVLGSFIYRSDDGGKSWTSTYYDSIQLTNIKWSKCTNWNCFVAIGNGNKIYRSDDGRTWTEINLNLSDTYDFIDFTQSSDKIYILTSDSSIIEIECQVNNAVYSYIVDVDLASTTGITNSNCLVYHEYSDTIFVFCSNGIKYATSGSTAGQWGSYSSPTSIKNAVVIQNKIIGITYSEIYESSDGETWTERRRGGYELINLFYNEDTDILLIYSRIGFFVGDSHTSLDSLTEFYPIDFEKIFWSNIFSKFFASDSYRSLYSSDDGETWNEILTSSDLITDICEGNDKLLICTTGNLCYSSEDGINFSTINKHYELACFNKDENTFHAISGHGDIFATSSDLQNWTEVSTNIYDDTSLINLEYSSKWKKYYISSDNINVHYSSDGETWTEMIYPSTGLPTWSSHIGIDDNSGLILISGHDGGISYSTDGISFNVGVPETPTGDIFTLLYVPRYNLFFLQGGSGLIITSNGIDYVYEPQFKSNSNTKCLTYSDKLDILMNIQGYKGRYENSDENLMEFLTQDSSLSFKLEPGKNVLRLSSDEKVSGILTFRQKYVGV